MGRIDIYYNSIKESREVVKEYIDGITTGDMKITKRNNSSVGIDCDERGTYNLIDTSGNKPDYGDLITTIINKNNPDSKPILLINSIQRNHFVINDIIKSASAHNKYTIVSLTNCYYTGDPILIRHTPEMVLDTIYAAKNIVRRIFDFFNEGKEIDDLIQVCDLLKFNNK